LVAAFALNMASSTAVDKMAVAQVSNLLYRSASSLRTPQNPSAALGCRTVCRLEIGDTAGWKPALPLSWNPGTRRNLSNRIFITFSLFYLLLF